MELPSDAGQEARFTNVSKKLHNMTQLGELIDLVKRFRSDVDTALKSLTTSDRNFLPSTPDQQDATLLTLESVKAKVASATDIFSKLESFPQIPVPAKLPAGVDDAMSSVAAIQEQRTKRKRDETVLRTSLEALRAAKQDMQFTGIESDNSCTLKRRKVCARGRSEADSMEPTEDGIPVVCETRGDVDLYLDQSTDLFPHVHMTILDVEPVLMTSANQLMVKLQIDDLFVVLILCRAVTRDIMEDGVSPTIKMLRVNVISHSEDSAGYHIYQLSQQKTLRKLTQEMTKALHFFRSMYPTGALRRFVLWLVKYDKLYSIKCKSCQKCLRQDEENIFEPPLMRDFRDPHSNDFYHPDCFPHEDRVY
eukprot:TRINITY_DN5242_c0_g1_i1.p1 TRINITY_DN5242_c0_g1~~TRINITY_DN5242_c0_g1_i1.p1  ORF type:complete len:364 (-),score=65.31 TRINITY_DN5242_c0_g1_i1:556-1647(-)